MRRNREEERKGEERGRRNMRARRGPGSRGR